MKQSPESRPAVVLSALAAVVVFSSLCIPGEYFGADHDGAFYALAARSLLRGAYALGISPGDPPLSFLTPGWPLLLAPAAALSQDNPLGYQLWAWLWLAACIPLTYLWMRPRMGAAAALLGAAAFGLNPFVLSRGGIVGSEPAALALSLALFVRLDSPRFLSGRAAGLWLGFLYLIRPASLIVWPAAAHYFFSARRRQFWSCAAWSLFFPILWLAWTHAGGGLSEVQELSMTLSGQDWRGYGLTAALNLRAAAGLFGRSLLPQTLPAESATAWGAGGLLLAASLLGALKRSSGAGRKLEPAVFYLGAGAGLHLLWAWWFDRYLLVFFPFMIWAVWAGIRRLLSRRAAAAFLALAAAAPFFPQSLELARTRQSRIAPEHAQAYRWMRENTPEHALFAGAFYAREAFYCARPFQPLPMGPEPLAERMRARRITAVFWETPPDLGSSQGADFYWARRLRRFEAELKASPLVKTDLPGGKVRLYSLPD